MPNAIRAIIFDVGGTLYVSPELDAKIDGLAESMLAAKLNVPLDEARRRLSAQRSANKLQSGDTTKVGALKAFGIERQIFHSAVADIDVSLFIHRDIKLMQCISAFKAEGLQLGIISNFQRRLVTKILDALGVPTSSFDQVIGEEDELPLKPNDAPFVEILCRLGTEAGQSVFVGDSVSKDIIPAKRNGMRAVLVRTSDPDDDPKNADAIVSHVSELAQFVADFTK